MAFEVKPGRRAWRRRGSRTVAELLEKTETLAARAGNPHAKGLAIWARGLSSYLMAHWKDAAEYCERAAEVLRDQCTGVTWELTIANRFMLTSLLYLGEMVEVSRRVPQLLSAALEQGNLFAATDLRTRLNAIWLAGDDPDRARDEVIAAMTTWPRRVFICSITARWSRWRRSSFTPAIMKSHGNISKLNGGRLEKSMLLRIQDCGSTRCSCARAWRSPVLLAKSANGV